MSQEEIKELLTELKQEQERMREELGKSMRTKKDGWDKVGAAAPIISGILISAMAGYFTLSYNHQQLRLQEIQTIEKFIPHLLGNEKSKKAAILAMSSLANTGLAAHFASLFASEGTVSALKSIATTGDTRERGIATEALQSALEIIAERYNVENRSTEAEDALREALELKEKALGNDHPDVPRTMDRLAELYKAHGKYVLCDALLKRSLSIKEKLYGPDDPTVATTLKNLADIYKLEGNAAGAEPLYNRALSIDEKVTGTASPATAPDTSKSTCAIDVESESAGPPVTAQEAESKPARTTAPSSTPISEKAEVEPAQGMSSNM